MQHNIIIIYIVRNINKADGRKNHPFFILFLSNNKKKCLFIKILHILIITCVFF